MTTLPPSSPPTPPTPPTSSTDGPSGTSSTFPPPTVAQLVRALRAPAVGYAWLLLGAVVITILIVVATNVGSTGADTGVESDDTNAIGVLIGMPFQLAGMALLGPLHFTEGGVSGSLFFPPLVLTGLYLLMTARAARRSEVISASGTRALLVFIVGLVAAVVVTPLTWVLAMRADDAAVHAASVSLFFGVWILTGLASYAGTTHAAGAVRPAWIPSDYVSAARLWVGSVAVWLVASVVVLTVVAAVEVGLWVAILAPVWGVTAGLYSYALGHLGSLSFGGEGTNLGDFSAVWTIAMVVAALGLAVLTSIAWHLRRDSREASLALPGSWVVLPATYAVGGLLVWLVPSVVLSGGMGGFGGSATLQPAFWLVFVLVVWGAAVEVASRFVAPSLVTALPPRMHALLRGPERVGDPPATETATPVEARPLTPEERDRYRKIGIVSGAVVAVGIVGWVAVSIVNSQFYGPEDQVADYLDAVVDGDLDEAIDLAPVDNDEGDDTLMTAAIYRGAESRITGYEIGDVNEEDDTVTVEVQLEGLDGSADAELFLEKDGHTFVLFDKWQVAAGGLASVVSLAMPDGASDLSVNDVAVDPVEGDVWLLPGSYVFDAFSGNEWIESSGEPVIVAVDEQFQYAEVPGAIASEAFQEEVQAQIDAHLDACMASTELEPENCPNAAYAYGDVRGVSWTLEQAPTANFESFDGTFPADLSYGDSGSATVTYEADQSYGFGRRDWQSETEESDLYLSSVTVTDEGGSLLVSISE